MHSLSSSYSALLDLPDLKLVLQKVEDQLQAEALRREAFLDWLTPDMKAEFINGETVMHSPVKRSHLLANQRLFLLLHTWVAHNQLGELAIEKALISLTRNDYEPDICFWRKEVADKFDGDTMRHPAPDLVVEVLSPSTEARDRGVKFRDYAAHGIREYWLIDPDAETVEVFQLNEEAMEYGPTRLLAGQDLASSQVLTGFAVPVQALFEANAFQACLSALLPS